MKDKSGQIMLVRIMLGILILVFIIVILNPTQQAISYATSSTHLNCSAIAANCGGFPGCDAFDNQEDCETAECIWTPATSATTNQTLQAVCSILEPGLLFYFIGILIAISLAVVQGSKSIAGVVESIFIFMVVVILVTPLKTLIILARDTSHLSCGTTGITTGASMLCIFIDVWLFYFVVVSIAGAITYVFNKKRKESE